MADNSIPDFLDFPNEMLLKILGYCDVLSLAKIRRTCKRLLDLVQDEVSRQYTMTLAAAGMCDGYQSNIHLLERKKRLDDYTEAWKELKWTRGSIIPLKHFLFGIRGGVIGTVSLDRFGPMQVHFHQIPSIIRNIPEKSWKIKSTLSGVSPMQFDPSQDLLLIGITDGDQAGTVYARLLSSGEPHPHSISGGKFELVPRFRPGFIHPLSTCIYGGLVALSFHSSSSDATRPVELFAVNWKTGITKLHLALPQGTHYTILDETHVLTLTGLQGLFLIYDLRDTRLADAAHIPFQTYAICRLGLPMKRHGWRAEDVGFLVTHDPPATSDEGIFYPSTDGRLVIITFRSVSAEGPHYSYLCMLADTLVSLATNKGTIRELSWEEWGPGDTLFDGPWEMTQRVVPDVAGARSVGPIGGAWIAGVDDPLTIFDFHPRRVPAILAGESEETVSKLPCTATDVKLPEVLHALKFLKVFITHDGLLLEDTYGRMHAFTI